MKEIQPYSKELGAAQATPPATPPAKEPEAPAPANPPAKEASEVSAGGSHLSKNEALADRLSKAFAAMFKYEPRIRVDAATAAGLKSVLIMMRKSGTINPVDEVSQIQTDNKGNSYLSLSIAEKIDAAFVAEPEKMLEVFNAGKAPSQGRG